MSAIFLPIILIVGALCAILVVFGRHLPDIARGFKERKEEKELPEPINELPVNPRASYLVQPQKNTFGVLTAKISVIGKIVIAKIIWGAQHIWPALKFLARMLAKLFHRVPRVSPTLFSFKREKDVETVDFPVGAGKPDLIATTTDIRVMEKNPLRYPEPMSDKLAELTQHKQQRTIVRPGRARMALKKREIPLRQGFEGQAENEKPEAKEKTVSAPVVEEIVEKQPEVVVEKPLATRAHNRHRATESQLPKEMVVVEPVKPEQPAKMEEFFAKERLVAETESEETVAPEFPSPPKEKKISFLARGAYTLNDKTQEISDQIKEGKFSVAESALIDVLSKNPRNTEAYRLLGIVYLKRKDYAQAREVFEEALRRDPEHLGLHGPLGLCYMSVGEYGRALSMYQQAHNMDETNLEYLEQLLIISSRMDRRPLVKMTAKKILALNPNHIEAKKILERVAVR